MEADTARSRFTREEVVGADGDEVDGSGCREPRLVRRRVSGDTPTLNVEGVKEVIVRHVPVRYQRLPLKKARNHFDGDIRI